MSTAGSDALQKLGAPEPTPAAPEATEGAKQDTAQADQQQDSEKVDWETQFKAEVAKTAKLEGDLKSQVGRQESGRQRDITMSEVQRTLVGLQAGQDANNEILGVFSKHLAAGTPEALPAEVAQVEQRAAQTAADRTYTSGYRALRAKIVALGGDDVRIEDAPELRETLGQWDAEADRQERLPVAERSLSAFSDIFVDAAQLVSDVRVSKAREGLGAERQQIEAAAKKEALQEADVDDMGTGSSAAGGGEAPTKDNIDALHLAGKVSDEVYRKFLKTGELK